METKSKLIEWTGRTHNAWEGNSVGPAKHWYGIRSFRVGLSTFYGIATPESAIEVSSWEFPTSGSYSSLQDAKDACEKVEAARIADDKRITETIREALNPIYAEMKAAMDESVKKYVLPEQPKPQPETQPEPATEPEPVKPEWKHISGTVWELLQGGKYFYCLEKIASSDDRRTVWEAYETDNKINKEIYKGSFEHLKDAQFNAVHGIQVPYPTMIEPEATRKAAGIVIADDPNREQTPEEKEKVLAWHRSLKDKPQTPETSAADLVWTETPYGEKSIAKFHEFEILRESDDYFTLKHRKHSESKFLLVEGITAMETAKQVARLMEKVEHGNAAIRAANPENSESEPPTQNAAATWNNPPENIKNDFSEKVKKLLVANDINQTQPAESKPKLILRFKDGRKPVNITDADRFEIAYQIDAVFLYLGPDQQAVHAYKWSEMDSISRVV